MTGVGGRGRDKEVSFEIEEDIYCLELNDD